MPHQLSLMPSQERLQELFDYSVVTGALYRRKGVKGFPRGRSVGFDNGNGYLRTVVDGHKVYNHRLVWKLVTGQEPTTNIDHIDGDSTNNAWHNLRLATQAQNCRNQALKTTNTSGFKGVSYSKVSKKWVATIWRDYRCHYLGLYGTPEQAHAAYVEAAERLHGEFARVQ